jgi:hypothetical protein
MQENKERAERRKSGAKKMVRMNAQRHDSREMRDLPCGNRLLSFLVAAVGLEPTT